MTDSQFLERFENCSLAPALFEHEAHVRMGWTYLKRLPLPEAMAAFRDSLKRYATSLGKTELYNETITFGFLLLIHDRLNGHDTWDAFRRSHPELLDWSANPLKAAYAPGVLTSPEAKRRFVLP